MLSLAVTWNMISLVLSSFITNSTQILTCPMIIKELEGKHDEISYTAPFYQPFFILICGWILAKIQKTVNRQEPETCREKCISDVSGRKSLYIISRGK